MAAVSFVLKPIHGAKHNRLDSPFSTVSLPISFFSLCFQQTSPVLYVFVITSEKLSILTVNLEFLGNADNESD
jgi:hypothetical protein